MAAQGLRAVDGGHGVKDAPASPPSSGDRPAGRSPGAAPGAAGRPLARVRAKEMGSGFCRSAAAAVMGGQAAVAEAMGIAPQTMGKICDEREERSIGLDLIILAAETCPLWFDGMLMSLQALQTRRRVYGGRPLLQLSAAANAHASGLMTGTVDALLDGVLDEQEERALDEQAEQLERDAREVREAVARSRAARLRGGNKT